MLSIIKIERPIDYVIIYYNVLLLLQFGRSTITKKYFEVKGEMNSRNNLRQCATTK